MGVVVSSSVAEVDVGLESVVATGELAARRRGPDYEAENRALVTLAKHLATSPRTILQKLAEATLELCRAHSAGLSLIEEEEGRLIFRWPAIAGRFAVNVLGTTPRNFSPCGVVVDRNAVQLFRWPARYYPYLEEASPPIVEALLQPFSVHGRPIGTIWAMAHDDERKFDAEDARALGGLASFASNAFQVLSSLRDANEADRRKDEFLALLSHEIRNPLHTAITWIEVLNGKTDDRDVQERGRAAIARSLGSISRMTDDLLDLSRITAGKVSIEIQDVDLNVVVQNCVEAMLASATEACIEIGVSLADASLYTRGDPTRLQQVIGNLLSNALKFTPSGGRIAVRVRRAGDLAEIAVTDTGEGIAPEALPFIFQRFRQGDTSVTRRHGGLGLGLAVAKHFVELHGGTIEAESAGPGEGATLTVRLPAAR